MTVLKFDINAAKSNFFDRKQTIANLDEQAHRGLSKFGAHVRRAVRRTLKRRRKKTLAEMTGEERQRYHIEKEILKTGGKLWGGRDKPFRPTQPSLPGEPPRMILGLIKKFLFFVYSREERSVVIGPAVIDRPTGAPEILEKGGYIKSRGNFVHIAQRPYMKPVFDQYYPKLPLYLFGFEK